ncbi:MAG TPA: HXXEE domain-containing protein [Candidatus Polarisedimenticolaceae bacterium]|nr:HXXEE domain-containing protein [Candidatus Polarisedimenticolaceae bacterium]
MTPALIPWLPLIAAVLHIVEEFVVPGGFAAWDRDYRPEFASTITPRFHVIVNALFLILCYDAGAMFGKPAGIALWLTVVALESANGVWHATGALRTNRYSPGMLTGMGLYVPLAVWGYPYLIFGGRASLPTAAFAFLIGISYQLWVGKAIHRWRKRTA